jgi:DNA-binding beta-propeller fold protein YncE
VKTSLTGEEIWVHGYPREDSNCGDRPIEFVPTNVAFAPNGDFYVGDGYGSSHILRYSLDAQFLSEVGKPGAGDGEFQTPHGLWVDPRGETLF